MVTGFEKESPLTISAPNNNRENLENCFKKYTFCNVFTELATVSVKFIAVLQNLHHFKADFYMSFIM